MSIAAGQSPGRTVGPTRRTTAPRKRGDDTRAKIIDETVRCIVEEGFAAATAKHVAERAGVTWGVIQYHFGDRPGLLMAVVDDGVDRLIESLSSADVSELPLRERIEVVVDTAWGCYSSPTSMAAFEILRMTRGGPDESSRRHLLEMNSARQILPHTSAFYWRLEPASGKLKSILCNGSRLTLAARHCVSKFQSTEI